MLKHVWKWTLGLAAFSFLLSHVMTEVVAQDEKPSAEKAVPAQKAKTIEKPTATKASEESESDMLTIGSTAPELDVEHWVSDGHGKYKPVTTFEPGKVYVVEFWATWCGPCIASMPHLAETQEKYTEKGVQIVSISDEDLETVEGFLKRPTPGSKAEEEGEEEAEDKKEAKEEGSTPATYGELTSAYCLTTDPDGSVKAAYMDAAGQNGIPTCFLVGKTGLIEWIGHPMEMDEPLEKVVTDKWDRAAYLESFRKEQERSKIMTAISRKLSRKMQGGDTAGALEILADAKKEAGDDKDLVAIFEQLEFRVKATSVVQKLQGDDVEGGLAELDQLMKSANAAQKSQLMSLKVSALLTAEKFDDAAKAIKALEDDDTLEAESMNQVSWQIYEAASEESDFSPVVIAAAASLAAKAVKAEPENGMILDTLAHLLSLQGELDQAIEVQSKAVEYSKDLPANVKSEMADFLKQLKKEKADK